MKKLFFFLLLTLIASCQLLSAQTDFKFRPDGTFIIMHVSDVHWDANEADKCTQTAETLSAIIRAEKPDVVILNGDIVTAKPAKEGWQGIIKIMEDAQVPFLLNNGNHDPEVATREEIFSWLSASKYYRGLTSSEAKAGVDRKLIPVHSAKDTSKVGSLIYCLDSGDYFKDPFVSYYAWIRFDQIAWYRSMSEKYAKMNGGTPVPAMMFFHIPTPEFKEVQKDSRTFFTTPSEEEVHAAAVNSGIFASTVEMGDVMGIVSGHDHVNDFIGINRGVALAYGRVGGWNAYGPLERGARIVRMYDGKKKFDSWVATGKGREGVFYYPSGITSIEEDKMTYLPALNVKAGKNGVAYKYYEGKFKKTADIAGSKVLSKGQMPNFSIQDAKVEDHFAYEFQALLRVPEREVYQFYTFTDDGSLLYIDGQLVVDNDGSHNTRRMTGKVALEAGLHDIKVVYFEDYMGQKLEIGITSKNLPEQTIPAEWLFLPR